MTRRWRAYLALALVAVMALTSQSMAIARGAAGVAGQIELCTGTGTGPLTVYVDETGKPTGPPHICPDFALHFLAFVTPPAIAPVPLAVVERAFSSRHLGLCAETAVLTACARDPPAAV